MRIARLLSLACLVALGTFVTQAEAGQPGTDPSLRRSGDPAINVPHAIRGVAYASLTGGKAVTPRALFGSHLAPDGLEARQGKAGNCYLIATKAVYAEFHPEVIKSVFLTKDGALRRSASGMPAARYFVKDQSTRDYKPADLATYDGRAPVRVATGKPALAKVVDHKIWAPMMEYSYTKFRNEQGGARKSDDPDYDQTGYNRTSNGGYANHVMSALTGKPTETVDVDLHHEDDVWNKLKAAQDHDDVVVVGTTFKENLRDRVKQEIADGHLDGNAKRMKFDNDDTYSSRHVENRSYHHRWVEGHAYSAWGDKEHPFLFERDGVRMIRLRNPWGTSAPGGHGAHGIGEIPFREFVMRFDKAWIGAGEARD